MTCVFLRKDAGFWVIRTPCARVWANKQDNPSARNCKII